MDCSELYPEAHTALRLMTLLARGSARKVTKSQAISPLETYMDMRHIVSDLEDEGYIETDGSVIQVTGRCPHKHLIDKKGPQMSFPALDSHIDEDSQHGVMDMAERSEGGVPKPPIGGFGYDNSFLATDDYYSYKDISGDFIDMTAPNVIRRRRIQKRVDSPRLGSYLERPVETWTAFDLASYWDAATLRQLWGRSPDRTNRKALMAHFADLIAENTPPATIRDMIDIYINSTKSGSTKIPSLWKQFISRKSQLFQQTTNPRTQKFERDTGTSGELWSEEASAEDDEGFSGELW